MGQLIGKVFKQTYYEEDDEIPTSESQTSTLRALASLFILFIVYILNQADRQLLPAVIPAGLACASENESQSCEPDWNTSDWMFSPHCDPNDCIKINTIQHGVLTGAAFVLSYTISGIPIGRIADLSSRTKVLGIGMFFWSAMVLLTGLAKDYWLILLARVGVGIGQASCNPTSYAMISDFFYVNRAKALAFYHSGLYIGSAIGYAAAAANDVICWRWPFFILAFLGFLTVMLVVLFIRDPQPEERILPEPVPNSLKETVHQLFKSKPFLVICLASSVRQIAGYALASWLSTYYARRYHIQPFKYNGTLALIVLFGGGFGTLLGGVTADRVSINRKQAKAYVIGVTQFLATPVTAIVFIVDDPTRSFVALFISFILAETWIGVSAAIVQDLFIPDIRAQASAVYIAINTLIGGILGPLLIPILTLLLHPNDECHTNMGDALLIVVPTCYLLCSILYVAAGILIKRQIQQQSISYLHFDTAELEASTTSMESEALALVSKHKYT